MRSIRPGTERNANETGHPYPWGRRPLHGDIGFDRSVLKLGSLEKGEDLLVRLSGQSSCFASKVFDCLCLSAGHVQIGQREILRCWCRWLLGGTGLCVCGKKGGEMATNAAAAARNKPDSSIALPNPGAGSVQVVMRWSPHQAGRLVSTSQAKA